MTSAALVAARLVLVAVFLAAGIGKLLDRPGARRAIEELGGPRAFAGALSVLLPAAELATAALLLPAPTARAGALAALGLLALFSVAIATGLARGRTPDCHCFGRLHSAPAGPATLARNAGLAVVAGFAAFAGADAGPGALGWIGDIAGSEPGTAAAACLALLAVAAATWAQVLVLRSQRRLVDRLRDLERRLADAGIEVAGVDDEQDAVGLPLGTPAPGFSLAGVDGHEVTLGDLLAAGERPLLLVFTDPQCGPCRELMPVAAGWQRAHAEQVVIAVASAGSPHAVRDEAQRAGLSRVLLDPDRALYRAFDGAGTPGAVLVAPDGSVGSAVAAGRRSIERLLQLALEWAPAETRAAPAPLRVVMSTGEPVT